MYQLEVTTQTWVIYSNVAVDNARMFQRIQCVPFCGPIRRMIVGEEDNDLPEGSIVFAEYLGKWKGRPFRRQKEKQMRNCATVIMKIDKYYNIKISKKGNFQVTGCISEAPVRRIVYHLWKLIEQLEVWAPRSVTFTGHLCCRMCNVRFQLPYQVNLAKLNETIKTLVVPARDTGEISSAYEPSIGYGGVNVKIMSYLQTVAETDTTRVCVTVTGDMEYSSSTLKEYLDMLDDKQRLKKNSKESQHSFLVFASGRVIMSGTYSEVNRADAFRKFCCILDSFHQYFQCSTSY